MSSTTSRTSARQGERGQVLVLFAGGILTLLVVAALAYDVGMMLVERRDSQNAADAAALAGARYIFEDDCIAPAWTCTKARAAALKVALANGYDDADPSEVVQLHIPPTSGRYKTFPNFLEVDINSERPSIFGAVVGRKTWPVGVFAVATNDQDLTFPFSMLALDSSACKAIQVSGTGLLEAFGNVQSNSNGSEAGCGGIGMSRSGGGNINVVADDATCRAAGTIQDQGTGTMTCARAENSFALPDPLRNLPAPAKPGLAPTVQRIGHTKAIEPHCPGATGAGNVPTETQTTGCDIAGNGGSSRGTAWLLSPGLYPAGLTIDNQARAYLLPGIYWIGGGGLQVNGDASLISVDSLATATSMNSGFTIANVKSIWNTGSQGGGVMIYNSKLPTSAGGTMDIGGGGGFLLVKAFFDPVSTPPDANEIYNNISIFQDRTVDTTVKLNGSDAYGELAGIIYVPAPNCPVSCVTINGSTSEFVVDQIIADTFKINGSGGTIRILRRVSVDAVIIAAGLVD